MPKDYSPAESVESIAGGLIPNYHPELLTARIMYVFLSEASKKNGKEVPGTAKKLTGFSEWALEQDFVLTVALDVWNTLTENQRMALVDHLLERCTGEEDEESGEMVWKMRDPDVQEFPNILYRHGAWNENLQGFVSTAQGVNIDQVIAEETEEEEETEQQTSEE